MEDTKKSRNGNKKMVIKMGGGGGGGIGAVILLGGALATAAFASAFVLARKKKDRRHKSEKHQFEHTREEDSTINISEDKETTKVDEDDPISDDGFVIANEETPLLVESIKEEISDHHSKEKTNLGLEHVSTEEDKSDGGEMGSKDGGNIDGVEGEENVEIINEKKCVEEASEIVFSKKTLLSTDSSVQIVPKSEEDKVEEKTASIIHLTMLSVVSEEVREHVQVINHVEEVKTSMENDAKPDQISPEEVEVVKYVSNENVELHENNDDSKRESEEELIVHEMSNMVNGEVLRNEVIERKSLVHTCAKTDRMKIMMDYGGDLNESEENSKWEAQWPKVSSKETKEDKGMSYEVGGKIQEDYSATKGKRDEVVKTNDQYPTRWRAMIWTLSVLSSLLCSWFFDLSSAKICLVVFLTVFMLEIYGYPLLNRKKAQCLHAAQGDRIYEQRSYKKKK